MNGGGGVSLRELGIGALVLVMGLVAGLLASMTFLSPPSEKPLISEQRVTRPVPPRPPQKEAPRPEVPRENSQESLSLDIAHAAAPSLVEDKPKGLEEGELKSPQSHIIPGTTQEPLKSPPKVGKKSDIRGKARPSPEREKKTIGDTSSGRRVFTVHLESFKNPQAAQKRVENLKAVGIEAFSQEAEIPEKGKFYRVFAGKFEDRASAKAFLDNLEKKGAIEKGRVLEIQPKEER